MNGNKQVRVYDDDVPEQAEEAWDKLADWYLERKRGLYEFKMQLPAIFNLLGDLRGKNLIDIGCGPGAYSVEFTKRGADVSVVDLSQNMLEKARDNAETANVELTLQKADAHSLPYKSESFDVAVLIFMILNTRIVEEAARVLKPSGLLLFSDTHPTLEAKGQWASNNIGAPRIIEDYFSHAKRKWRITPGLGRTITLKYHTYTIEQCVNMIADADFKILRIAEPNPGKDVKKSDPIHYDRCSRIPYFIIYLAEKHA